MMIKGGMYISGMKTTIIIDMIMRDNAVSKDHYPCKKDQACFYFNPFPQLKDFTQK